MGLYKRVAVAQNEPYYHYIIPLRGKILVESNKDYDYFAEYDLETKTNEAGEIKSRRLLVKEEIFNKKLCETYYKQYKTYFDERNCKVADGKILSGKLSYESRKRIKLKEISRIVYEAKCNYYQKNKDEMVTLEEARTGAADITEADIPEKEVCAAWQEEGLLSQPVIFKDRGKGRRPLHCKSLMYEIAAVANLREENDAEKIKKVKEKVLPGLRDKDGPSYSELKEEINQEIAAKREDIFELLDKSRTKTGKMLVIVTKQEIEVLELCLEYARLFLIYKNNWQEG